MSSPNKHRAGGCVCILKALPTSSGMSHDFLSTIPLSATQIWSQRWACSPSLTRLRQLQSFLTTVAVFLHACCFVFFFERNIYLEKRSAFRAETATWVTASTSAESQTESGNHSQRNTVTLLTVYGASTSHHVHTHTRARVREEIQ